MNLQQLMYFKRIAENQNITRTAQQLMVSPPALSATISRLEKELGCNLFDRKGRNIYLNEHGKILLGHANTIFSEIENAKNELRNRPSEPSMKVAIGITSSMIWHSALEAFAFRYPDITLTHTLLRLDQLHDQSVCMDLDFIITASNDITDENWESETLNQDNPPCLAVHPSHQFASYKDIRLIQAKDERFIMLSKGYSFRVYSERLCELAGFTPNIILECDFGLRPTMLAAGYGITISTRSVAKTGALGNLTYIDITDPVYHRLHSLFWNKKRHLGKAAVLFRDFILKETQSRDGHETISFHE